MSTRRMPDTAPLAEPSTLRSTFRWHTYVVLFLISLYLLSALYSALFAAWTFCFLVLTLFILLRLYYDRVFVPYKPLTTVLPDSVLVLYVGISFFLGTCLTHPPYHVYDFLAAGGKNMQVQGPGTPSSQNNELITWIVLMHIVIIFPFSAVRKLSSFGTGEFDMKALTFLTVTCSFSSMVSSVVATSLDIVPSWQTGLVFFVTSLIDVASVLLLQLLYVTFFSSSMFGFELALSSGYRNLTGNYTSNAFVEALAISMLYSYWAMDLLRAAPSMKYSFYFGRNFDWQNVTYKGEDIVDRSKLFVVLFIFFVILPVLFGFVARIWMLRHLHGFVTKRMSEATEAYDSRAVEEGRSEVEHSLIQSDCIASG